MCGINGFTFQDSERLRKMHTATRHRGPDDDGFFEAPGISFAHNRLSVIDPSQAAHQPMTTDDGRFTIIFNGEIYNFRELRKELELLGVEFHSQSDTEVLLLAFSKWGEKSFLKLNGIFSFAIWDMRTSTLTIVRDRMGVKPLYYHFDGTHLIFSSEMKSLLCHPILREMDLDAFNIYFRFLYVPGSRTMISNIKKLEPGSVLTFKNGALTIRKWWTLSEGEYMTDYNDAVGCVREATKSAVQRQLVSDRPLGIFLSGGIDSTSILGIMSEVATGPIKTFSVGYETEFQSERYNADARLAARSAEHFGADHHALTLTPQDAISSFEEIVRHMDEPVSNHIQSSTYLLAKYAQPEITVALGGDGGDELFGGYSRYWYSRFIDRVRAVPLPFRDRVISFVIGSLLGRRENLPMFLADQGLERFLVFMMQKEDLVRRFISPSVNRSASAPDAFRPYFNSVWKDRINQHMAVDVQTWLPDESLLRSDKLTMAHGLEERVPLLDHDLVDLAFRIPSKWKLGTKQQGKRIFIDAMRPYLPEYILREEKRAWLSPAAKWIRGPMLPFAREILSEGFCAETAQYLDFKAIEHILDDHVNMKSYTLNTVWSLMTFQMWYRSFIMRS
ncbi:MAG: asparagine synthase (glutamine-hydrolyzing) [bacterium]|nr:asparagine synthase (glutamine-hydrolyzing) [bacterium]